MSAVLDERELPPGIGRYRIVRLLGRGAMGRVLLARDPVLDRDVAVKLLRDDLPIAPEQRSTLFERMRQEARASARVAHPNIVGLYDMGEDPEFGLYLVFEYAEGPTLKDRLLKGPLGPEASAKLVRQIGDALATAHQAGVLHRDIKPENIMLTPTGGKIADFGIARVPDSTLTRDGGLLGTPAYSAPECIKNGTFSPASDQFSLAATFYETLSGQRAFPGEDAILVASRIATEEPAPIALACGLDRHVDGVFLRALAKDPTLRFPTARDFADALAEALESRTRSAQPTLPDREHRLGGREFDSRGRAPKTLLGGVALGVLLGAAGVQLTSGLRQSEQEAYAAPPDPLPSAPAVAYVATARKTPRVRPSASASKSKPAPELNSARLAASAAPPLEEHDADAGPPAQDGGAESTPKVETP